MQLLDLTFHPDELAALLTATHGNPFAFLGPHQVGAGRWVVRAFLPHAREVALLDVHRPAAPAVPMPRVHPGGFFEVVLDGHHEAPDYRLRILPYEGPETTLADPYSFGPILGELDLHLFAEGNHRKLYEKLGAHLRK